MSSLLFHDGWAINWEDSQWLALEELKLKGVTFKMTMPHSPAWTLGQDMEDWTAYMW